MTGPRRSTEGRDQPMRTHNKHAVAALTAAAFMLLAVSTAAARRLEASNQRFLGIWTSLEFTVEGLSPILCPMTVEGSFHSRTISKVSGSLIGYLTNARIRAPCTNGTATVLTATLPWHVRYSSFSGTLPNITRVALQLVGTAFRVESGGSVCLVRTTAAAPAIGNIELSGGVGQILRADETRLIPLNEGGVCDFFSLNGSFRGSAEVFLLGSTTTRITVRLVQ
jgi:hypothetical protein